MGVNVVHYVEKFYNAHSSNVNYNYKICMVDSRDPLNIEEEKDLVGFRFFDVFNDCASANLEELFVNYSGMYYFGERVTYKKIRCCFDDDFVRSLQFDYLYSHDLEEAIFCDKSGKIISDIGSDDITIEEEKARRCEECSDNIFINQNQFLSGICNVIEEKGNYAFVVASESMFPISDVITGTEVDNLKGVIRNYDLYVNNYFIGRTFGIINSKHLGAIEKDSYVRLSDALSFVRTLYGEFPYLEVKVESLMSILWDNQNVDLCDVLIGKSKTIEKSKCLLAYFK